MRTAEINHPHQIVQRKHYPVFQYSGAGIQTGSRRKQAERNSPWDEHPGSEPPTSSGSQPDSGRFLIPSCPRALEARLRTSLGRGKAQPNQAPKAPRGAVLGLRLAWPAPELGAQPPEDRPGGHPASLRQAEASRRVRRRMLGCAAAASLHNGGTRRWRGAAPYAGAGPPWSGATPPPGGPSRVVGGHPENIESFPNELCIETFSFAASLLMHINECARGLI